MRMAIENVCRKLDQESRSPAACRIDGQRSSNPIQAFLHADESQASWLAIRRNGPYIKAHAVVFDRAEKQTIFSADADRHSARFGMFRRVGQGFLNNAVEGYFDGTRQPAHHGRFDLNAEVGAL
jgi:hypothetical protein